MPDYIKLSGFNPEDLWGSFVFAIVEGKFNVATWFIRQIIILSIITPILLMLVKNKNAGFVVLILIAVLQIYFPYIWVLKTHSTFFYMLGIYLGTHMPAVVENTDKTKSKFYIAIAIFVLAQTTYFIFGSVTMELDLIFSLSMMATLWIILDFVDIKLYPLMGLTFFIFMGHSLLVESSQKIIFLFLPKTDAMCMFNFIFSTTFSIFALILVGKILESHFKLTWAALNGSRPNRIKTSIAANTDI